MANSIGARVHKMNNYVEEDRISQLPDEILITILSLLPFVEAASTNVLSKRWKYLWTYAKCLCFDVPKKSIAMRNNKTLVVVERPKFISWVNRVLQLHQSSNITEFKVSFDLDRNSSCDIDKWLSFAIGKRVQRLEVDLKSHSIFYPSQSARYTFSDKVYSLIKSPFGLSCIKSLTQLSLKYVNVTGELVEHFLSNCPFLERLCVLGSGILVNLKVSGHSLCLKFLEISYCFNFTSVDIYAPNLASFICTGIRQTTLVLVRHAPSLLDVTVGACGCSISYAVSPVSSYFSQLESLTLCMSLSWVKYELAYDEPPLFPKLPNLKNLTLRVSAGEQDSLLDYTSLIERSPFLRRFTLQLMSLKRIRENIRSPAKCLHKCLQVVEFIGNIDFELGMYFIQNAIALEKIIVDCRPPFLPPAVVFIENERSNELRKRALELKREVPDGVELVMLPSDTAQGDTIQVPSSA